MRQGEGVLRLQLQIKTLQTKIYSPCYVRPVPLKFVHFERFPQCRPVLSDCAILVRHSITVVRRVVHMALQSELHDKITFDKEFIQENAGKSE